jgi:hypothetical protein
MSRAIVSVALLLATAAPSTARDAAEDSAAAASTSKSKSLFLDPQDGWFDLSAALDTGRGFVPIVVPVTEPAVGYGLGGGLVFVQRNPPLPDGGYRRPNMSVVGGMATDNGTWAGFAGHSGSWRDDRFQTLVGGVHGSIHLDFYGVGDDVLNDNPVAYVLEPTGGVVQARCRLGTSPVHVGLGYGFASIDVSFEDESPPAQIAPGDLESRVAGLAPALVYDTRNNAFTPTRGIFAELGAGVFAEALGGTSNFERISLIGILYHPLASRLFGGARMSAAFSFDDTPFYALPYIGLRGAPVLRYLGEWAASVEVEARWQFWRRISAVGFVGTGTAWNELDRIQDKETIVTGGGGFRYELARRYGLHMGVDVAWGPDETALYIQFGNAWFRP